MMLEELLDEVIKNELTCSKKWDTYFYYGKPVPRVSTILSEMSSNESLLGWANGLGFRRQKYDDVRQLAADKGTASHNLIEEFLNTNIVKTDFEDIPSELRVAVYNCYNGFLSWFNMMKTHRFTILDIEKTLVCPYCGGTLDLLVNIDGKTYIADLKTSNHMNMKYYIQLGAYTYMIENYYNIKIDGVLILWLDKTKIRYMDYVLDRSNPQHEAMLQSGITTFLSMLYAYYNKCYLEDQYNSIFGKFLV